MVRNTVIEVDPSKSENQSNLSNLEHIQEIQYYEGQTYFPAASHSSPSILMSGLWRVHKKLPKLYIISYTWAMEELWYLSAQGL